VYNDNTFGFLRLTVSPTPVAGVFVTVDPTSGETGIGDSFTVDLHASTVSSSGSGGPSGAPTRKRVASSKAKQANRPLRNVGARPPKATVLAPPSGDALIAKESGYAVVASPSGACPISKEVAYAVVVPIYP
jgi:hypothetical protein